MGQFINMILSGSLSTPFISHETHLRALVLQGFFLFVCFCLVSLLACARNFFRRKDKILGSLSDPRDYLSLEENTSLTQIRMVHAYKRSGGVKELRKLRGLS